MMKHLLLSLVIGSFSLATAIPASAEVTRSAKPDSPLGSRPKCVTMPKSLAKRLRAVETNENSGLKTISSSAALPKRRTNSASSPKMKANTKASNIEGHCIYREGAGDPGWYTIQWPADKIKWKRPAQYSPVAGFVRGSELYAFYSLASTEGLVDAGLCIQDIQTGEPKEYFQTDIFDSLEQVVIACGYDEANDVAYLATYNKAGTGMILQKFDPVSKAYTSLGVKVPDAILDMAWNPADESLYILDEGGALQRYDSKAKKFNTVLYYSYDMTDYPNDMVYSPKDEAFFALLDSYDESDYPCTDAVLLGLDGKVSYLGTISNNPQYSIISIADTYVNSDAPKAPVFGSWNVTGAAVTGSLNVTLPSTYENGKPISGTVYVQTSIDGMELTGSKSGAPGSSVAITFSSTEGLHQFKVTPYVLTDDGRLYGTPLIATRYLGNDTPASPANVRLTANQVSWDAVTSGANNGYVNSSDVRYIVAVDGVRMNETPVAGTSLSIVMPATGAVAHKASVVAVAGGKESQPGVSAKFYADGPLSLPVTIAVEEGESDLDQELIDMFTVVKDPLNREDLRGWRYDDQSEHTGGFYCLTPKESSSGDNADEWLFLPPINFPDKDAHYRMTMDVWTGNHYFSSDEHYEVYISKQPSKSRATLIREEDVVYKRPYFELSETLFQVPEAGEYYIGIRYISPLDSYRLYARNFNVEKVAASADSPAEVTDLTAVAGADGKLAASLSFKLPETSISGTPLEAASTITATAKSSVAEASVSGRPGEKVTLLIETIQGTNIIQVSTSSDAGIGLTKEVEVYTGVYRPGVAIVDCKVSDDNQVMTLNIELDDYNDKNQFVGPDECDVTIYRKTGGEWRVAAEIGKNRTWEFTCPEPSVQDLYQFGVAARNAVGYCEEMTSFGVHLGKLFTLPMNETFPTSGENVSITYEPITLEHISYLPGDWGFCNPEDADDMAANESGVALYATWESETQASLPRFSTKGMHNVKLDLSMFFGNKSPEMVTVFATSPNIVMEPVASFTPADGSGWEHKLVSLPSTCQNQGWVQIVIRVNLKGYSQFFLLDSYSIADYPENMLTITGMKGASRAALGDCLSYEVTVENAGTKAMAMPKYDFVVLSDNGVAAELSALDAPASIDPKGSATLHFEFYPKKSDIGELLARINIEGQPAVAVSEAEWATTLINAAVPVVTDLKADIIEGSVALNWSVPSHCESFEAFEPWDYSEEMRGFRNLDLDGGEIWGIGELNYPAKYRAKAWQVFTGQSVDNPLLQAHSGDYYLACMSAKKGVSNDWLISPEVKGGTPLSFWLQICDSNYPETILVKYSAESSDPADFRDLPGGYICPEKREWEKYSFTLPANAKYFALHHVGDDGQEQFGLMVDDLAFSPIDALPVEGYNVYRNHQLIASEIDSTSFTDLTVDPEEPILYQVKTLSTVNGEKVESDRSNAVWVHIAGISEIASTNPGIYGGQGAVIIEGFAPGCRYNVSNTAGMCVAAGILSEANATLPLPAGVYVVVCGSQRAKVIVR